MQAVLMDHGGDRPERSRTDACRVGHDVGQSSGEPPPLAKILN